MHNEEATVINLNCPQCGGRAVYRYGKYHDLQKYACIHCGRQFVPGHERILLEPRPFCKQCGKKMHLYKETDQYIQFRCSAYPQCRTFLKITKKRMEEK